MKRLLEKSRTVQLLKEWGLNGPLLIMPRVSREVKALAEAHEKTMKKTPLFELWAHRHLRNKDRVDEYRKAYELVHKGEEEEADEQETV